MLITLVSQQIGLGAGTAGYGSRLRWALQERGHRVLFARPGEPTVGKVIGLERVPDTDLLRLGGGWHTDACRSIGRWPYTRSAWLDRAAVRSTKQVVVNSQMVAKALSQRGIHSTVVRTGVNLERFHPQPDSGAIVFVAHGWRRKNFQVAVLAAARVPGRPVWVGGRDGRRRSWMRWARRLLGERLIDLGEQVVVDDVLPRAAVVLHPTLYDPASNLVLEAMAAGVPVVSTRCDGSAELLPRELVVLDPHDVDEVLWRLERALAGGRALGATLRQSVESWPDSRNARELELLLGRCGNG